MSKPYDMKVSAKAPRKKAATTKTSSSTKFKTVDEYINSLAAGTKSIFKELHKTIKQAAPGAEEVISYNIPSLKLNGGLIWYAAWKEHVSMYPATASMEAAIKELSSYKASKGTLKFSLDKPLPLQLIKKIVQFRVRENLRKNIE